MIDPVTAFAAANAAFKGVKMLVGAGREIHDVSQQLGAWYGAVADITRAESQRKNPTWLDKKTHGSENIEQEAMDIIVRKKTLLEKEKEIKFMLDYRFGLGTYDEMLGMRRKIRADREETVYRAMEAKRQIQNNMAIAALSLGIISVLGEGFILFTWGSANVSEFDCFCSVGRSRQPDTRSMSPLEKNNRSKYRPENLCIPIHRRFRWAGVSLPNPKFF